MHQVQLNFVTTLRRLPLFTDLGDAELALLAENVTRLNFEEGAIIFSEGETCRQLLIVEDGEVKIVKSAPNGREQLISIERKGSSLAEIAVLDGIAYPATAKAVTPAVILRLPADRFRQICVQNPEMTLKVFKVLGRRMRHLVSLVEELSSSTVRARLVGHLVRLAEESGRRTPQGIQFELSENNQEMAVRLGTVRELVSRNLGRLHGEGLIRMTKRTVNIPDLQILRDEISRNA
ncbi:MAG TPA: Crp/Fnr family transcriptional regulator [Candidatus Acidoferrales bacterium]